MTVVAGDGEQDSVLLAGWRSRELADGEQTSSTSILSGVTIEEVSSLLQSEDKSMNGIEICYWMHKVGRHLCEILIAHKGAQTLPIEADQSHEELEGHVPKPWEHCKIQEPTVRIYETYFWAPVLWHIHIQEFLNVKKSMVALLTPKCVSKYAMLDCIEGIVLLLQVFRHIITVIQDSKHSRKTF